MDEYKNQKKILKKKFFWLRFFEKFFSAHTGIARSNTGLRWKKFFSKNLGKKFFFSNFFFDFYIRPYVYFATHRSAIWPKSRYRGPLRNVDTFYHSSKNRTWSQVGGTGYYVGRQKWAGTAGCSRSWMARCAAVWRGSGEGRRCSSVPDHLIIQQR